MMAPKGKEEKMKEAKEGGKKSSRERGEGGRWGNT